MAAAAARGGLGGEGLVPRLEVGNVRRSLALVTLVILIALMAPAAGAQDEDEVVLTIGLTQPLDTLNVTAGFLVSEYEFWTLQYATLTDKAAEDFAPIPGLAESWEVSEDGLTVTYTLREGLLWSDGEPLTADDVAWTINTSAEQEWLNHASVTGNLTATALDERTVEIVTAEPDPRLPTMDAYILPQAHLGAGSLRPPPRPAHVSRRRRGGQRSVRARRAPPW